MVKKKKKRAIKFVAVIGVMITMLLATLPLMGAAQFWLTEVDNIEELHEMFPEHYFFDFSAEIVLMGTMHHNMSGCFGGALAPHGYMIRYNIVLEFLEYFRNLGEGRWFVVYSDLRDFGNRRNIPENATIHIIDEIEVFLFYNNDFIYLMFMINDIPYTIELNVPTTEKWFSDFIEFYLSKIITPAITNRTKGATL